MKFIALLTVLLIVFSSFNFAQPEEKAIIFVYDEDAFYSLIATSLSFHLGKRPILLFKNETKRHERFIRMYGANEFISIGGKIGLQAQQFLGDAPNISIEIARKFYGKADYAVVLPYNDYALSLIATPIACYLDAPLLVYKNNSDEIEEVCNELNAKIISIGNVSISAYMHLKNEKEVYDYIKSIHDIEYIAIANPNDTVKPDVIEKEEIEKEANITNLKIFFFIPFNLFGSDGKSFYINVPDGIWHIEANISSSQGIIYASLYDENGKLIAYSNSMGCGERKCYFDTLSINHAGKYRLSIIIKNGIEGGYFIPHGFSFVNAGVKARIVMERVSSPRLPLLHISKLAPFLACSHNGMVFATKNDVSKAYRAGMAGGGWNNAALHPFINKIVNETVEKLQDFVNDTHARWLAIVGDSNMLPMYYYDSSNNDSSVGLGIPSDNPYSLNFSMAIGRIIAFDDIDASLLIARSVFYNDIVQGTWRKRFVFIFGEGFGETGGIFHQLPYSKIVKSMGFDVSIYGDFRNDRHSLEKNNAFNASYIEYEGHGDWFWMFSNIYTNYYSNVDTAHAKNYEMNPSIVLTAACLMARIDGIPLNENIGLAFIHAGAVAFIGATRETGKEAKLDWIEDNLIKNDTSIGEAFILSKLHEKMPTKAARVLYGDPALNPWEPK